METKNLMMVMAALAMAGCSQNEVTEVNPDAHPVIGFDVYTGVQTRGAETDITALKGKDAGFGFFAYKTEGEWKNDGSKATPDFLYNEHGTWTTTEDTEDTGDNGSWGYTNTRFWPTNSDKISFFAYAPYEANPTDGKNKGITLSKQDEMGAPTLEFALPTSDKWGDMVDLVTDNRTAIQDLTAANNSGTVSFKFSHVLTKVADIKVKPNTDLGENIKIYVTNLKLVPGKDKLQNKAKYQFSDNTWVAATDGASYFKDDQDQDLSDFLNKATNVNWYGYTTSSVDVSKEVEATSLFPTGQALYFIPVNNDNGTGTEGDLKLKIKYDIVTKVSKTTNVFSTTEKTVDLPAGTFKKGTAYTYILTIKLNAISIDVDEKITKWDEKNWDDDNKEDKENKENEEGMEA